MIWLGLYLASALIVGTAGALTTLTEDGARDHRPLWLFWGGWFVIGLFWPLGLLIVAVSR